MNPSRPSSLVSRPEPDRVRCGHRASFVLFLLGFAAALPAQDQVVGWGSQVLNGLYHDQSFAGVGAGASATAAIRADGTVVMWGSNANGQCNVPALPPGVSVTAVSGGGGHTLALLSNGTILAWGRNDEGQCTVPPLPPGVVYTRISAGQQHSLALRSDGQIAAFGSDSYFQLQVPPGGPFVSVAAAANTSLAITATGGIVVFGEGQLQTPPTFAPGVTAVEVAGGSANGYLVRRSDGGLEMWGPAALTHVVPVLAPGTSWTKIGVLSNRQFVALRSDGLIITWAGMVGQPPTPVATLPPGMTWTDIATSGSGAHLVARRSDGRVVVTTNFGGFAQANVPPLPPGTSYTSLAFTKIVNGPTDESTFALRSDGQILAWGNNQYGQLLVPVLGAGLSFTAVAAGDGFAAALLNNGWATAWGQYFYAPLPPAPGLAYTAIAAGADYTITLRSDGVIVPAGASAYGATTIPALPPGTTWTRVAARENTSMALRSDGVIRLFGENAAFEPLFTALPPGVSYTKISAGAYHYAALRSDGILVVVGDNSFGQTTVPANPPGVGWVEVAAGDYHTMGRRSDGSVVVWGLNDFGGVIFGNTAVPTLPSGYSFGPLFAGTFRCAALVSAVPTVSVYGTGCTGTNGVTALGSAELPFLGNPSFTLDLSGGAVSSPAYLFVAAAEAVPPVPLGPGCRLYLDLPNALAFVAAGISPIGPITTSPAGTGAFDVALPAHPGFDGFTFYFQALAIDVGAPLGLTMSNGLRATLN